VEVAEVRFPLFFHHHEFRSDSGGKGRYAGGAGCDLAFTVETDEACVANTAGDGLRHGARGMMGGEDGAPHCYVLHQPMQEAQALSSKQEGIPVAASSRFEVHSGGGGGWGPPSERSAASIARDRQDGLIS
jgi:N-methylhydantoinase B